MHTLTRTSHRPPVATVTGYTVRQTHRDGAELPGGGQVIATFTAAADLLDAIALVDAVARAGGRAELDTHYA